MKKKYNIGILGSNSICFESSIINNCSGEDKILNNFNSLKGEFHCHGNNCVYLQICAAKIYFDVIDKSSISYNTICYYFSNKQKLIEKRNKKIKLGNYFFKQKKCREGI